MEEILYTIYLMPIIIPVAVIIYVLISLLFGTYEEVEKEPDINDLLNALKEQSDLLNELKNIQDKTRNEFKKQRDLSNELKDKSKLPETIRECTNQSLEDIPKEI